MTDLQARGMLGDYEVGRIGFGAMQLAGPGVIGPPRDPDAARAVLRRAIELGVDHVDTAQFYGPDVVNDLIREALHPYPESLRLVTKIGARRDDKGAWLAALEPADLRRQVEANLRSLGVERLALVNLRLMETGAEELALLTDQLEVLTEMRAAGKLDLIGISNVPTEFVEAALEIVPDLGEVQNSFSIVDQRDRATLDLCADRGVAYVPFFPLGSAITGGPKALGEDEAIAAVADRRGATPSQVALAWLLALSDRVLLIPGTGSIPHLEENLAAGGLALDADDVTTLEGVHELGDPMARAGH